MLIAFDIVKLDLEITWLTLDGKDIQELEIVINKLQCLNKMHASSF